MSENIVLATGTKVIGKYNFIGCGDHVSTCDVIPIIY